MQPLVQLDNEAVVIEAVKAADDRSGDVVLRCYESHGGRATATLRFGFPVRSAAVTDLLEKALERCGRRPGQRCDPGAEAVPGGYPQVVAIDTSGPYFPATEGAARLSVSRGRPVYDVRKQFFSQTPPGHRRGTH